MLEGIVFCKIWLLLKGFNSVWYVIVEGIFIYTVVMYREYF